jgi:hypothetical protein
MRSYRPFLTRSIQVGGLGKVTVADAVIVGVMAALTALVWHYII